jgi:hypothetical protein
MESIHKAFNHIDLQTTTLNELVATLAEWSGPIHTTGGDIAGSRQHESYSQEVYLS